MVVLLLSLPKTVAAQLVPGLPISVELRPSASFPVGDFGKENPGFGAEAAVGVAVGLHVRVTPSLYAYGTYEYERFGCGACGAAGFEDHLPEAGFEVGLEGILPVRMGRIDPWVGGGVLIGRRLEIVDGGDGVPSESATGWSAAAGVRVPIGPSVWLRPGIRYRNYSTRFVFPDLGFALLGESGTLERPVDFQSVALEVGLLWQF